MPRRKRSSSPKWRLKANWLLRELVRIWYGKAEPYPLFEKQNFVEAFTSIMIQSFLDIFEFDDTIWNILEYMLRTIYEPDTKRIVHETQASQAREVLMKTLVLLHKRPFLYKRVVTDILWMAHQIEKRLKAGQKPPYKPVRGMRGLSYYESLPVLPIY